MALRKLFSLCLASIAVVEVSAHGGAHQKPIKVDPDANWATRHLAEEHHISNFDPGAFFTLHDYDDNGSWEPAEILKTYGMDDPSAKDVPEDKKREVVTTIMKLMDKNGDGIVEHDEWMLFCHEGKTLPDFGLGPGHHWDIEIEYELHHWEKFHDENTKEEDLTHPEDIAHFKMHDDLEDEAERVAAFYRIAVVEQNIPKKYRRDLVQ